MATEIPDGKRNWKTQSNWHLPISVQDALLVAEAQRNYFTSARELTAATSFVEKKCTVILRLKEAGLRE
jgi:hypothetical protein